ncbi:hypothetical protein FRB90_010182 [Tulasnella sp. 427]|nr:hypothetical protein FRB90_010182 [Tulasnella sp. 427]
MVTTNGLTATRGLPGKPGRNDRYPEAPSDIALKQVFNERLDSLKVDIKFSIQNMKWPSGSRDAAEGLRQIVELLPNIPGDITHIPESLINAFEDDVQCVACLIDSGSIKSFLLLESLKIFIPALRMFLPPLVKSNGSVRETQILDFKAFQQVLSGVRDVPG